MTNETIEKELLEAESTICAAVKQRDRAKLDNILAQEFVATGHAGNVVDKAEYLQIHLSPEREFTVFDASKQIFRIYDAAAIVMGEIEIVNAKMPDKHDPPKRYTAVYVRKENDWKCAAWQETPIQKDEKF